MASALRACLREFAQSMLGLLTGLVDMAAGAILSASAAVIARIPWAPLVIPPLLSFRGSVMGILAGRISTGIHLGTVQPSIRGNTRHFYSLLTSAYLMRLVGVAIITAATYVMAEAAFGGGLAPYDIAVPLLSSLEVSYLATLVVVMWVCSASYRLGVDPDYILYPAASSVADVFSIAALVAILYVYGVAGMPHVPLAVIALSAVVPVYMVRRGLVSRSEVYRVFREALLSIAVVAVITSVTAVFLREIVLLGSLAPVILLIYPSLLTTIGDAGCMLGSTLTTKLHMGEVGGALGIAAATARVLMPILAAYAVMLAVYGGVYPLALGMDPGAVVRLLLPIVVAAGLMSLAAIAVLNAAVVGLTFRAGLDPDHFVNPIVSTVADLMGTVSLLAAAVALAGWQTI